jgi:hypothetical protein
LSYYIGPLRCFRVLPLYASLIRLQMRVVRRSRRGGLPCIQFPLLAAERSFSSLRRLNPWWVRSPCTTWLSVGNTGKSKFCWQWLHPGESAGAREERVAQNAETAQTPQCEQLTAVHALPGGFSGSRLPIKSSDGDGWRRSGEYAAAPWRGRGRTCRRPSPAGRRASSPAR